MTHWSAGWPVLAAYLVLAASHLAGLARLTRLGESAGQPGGDRAVRWEALTFHAGLLLVLIALLPPAAGLADRYIWVRMLQALLVAVVAPGLMVLGAPWDVFRGALGRPASRSERARWLTARPWLAVSVATAVWLVWQVPALFDRAEVSAGLALAEHASYLVAGVLFWLQVSTSRPIAQPVPPLRRIGLVLGALAASTVVGVMLAFSHGVVYPAYANSAHRTLSVLDDQQLGGAVWWLGMLLPMTVAAVGLMMKWLRDEESAALSAGLDRLLTPRKHGWPSRPVIR